MLHSDFPFEVRGWPQRALRFLLSESFLGFLAIASAALTLIPMLFQLRPASEFAVETGQWFIVGLFGVEYVMALAYAPDRKGFLLNPWRLLDFLTIAIPLITILPNVSDLLRSSPVLRLVRLVRVVALGLRASGVVVRKETRQDTVSRVGPVEVAVLRGGNIQEPQPSSWEEFLRWAKSPGPQWYHVANLSLEQLRLMAAAVDIPSSYLESHLFGASYPHIETTDRHAALFLWFPEFRPDGPVERNGLLLLASADGLLTMSRRSTGLLQVVTEAAAGDVPTDVPFVTRMIRVFLQAILDRNEEMVGRYEAELRTLEEVPVRESRPPFFEQTFRLKKELSAAQSDLWRLKGILAGLAEARVRLPGGAEQQTEALHSLAEDADYLYETVVNTREGLLSLIDLHLNVVSFEMNRVMRVLAVVSVLGLLPAVVGGLLGMNLADNPWPFTLPQVSFGVCLGMVLSLYFFLVKGWLR